MIIKMSKLSTWLHKSPVEQNSRMIIFLSVLFVVLLLSIGIILSFGYLDITWSEITRIIWSSMGGECVNCVPLHRSIVLDVRLPRIIAAIPVGAGLALSGAVLQTITRNNLADPYLFGISGAGAFGGTVALVYLQVPLGSPEFYLCVFAAVMLSLGILLQLVYYFRSFMVTYMLLGGVALGYIWQGLQSYILIYSPQEAMYVWSWQNGGLAVATWLQIWFGLAIIMIMGIFLYHHAIALDALALGTESAIISGVDVFYYRLVISLSCGVIVGLVVTIVGVIGFVGLVVPHIVRYILQSSAHRMLIPCSMLLGSLFLVWSDFIARIIGGIYDVSVNTVSSFFGALFFLVLLVNMYRSQRIK